MVSGHSLSVRYHTFCCLNALRVYVKPNGGAEATLSCSWVGGHFLSVRYHTFYCSNALKVYEVPDGATETCFRVLWSVAIPSRWDTTPFVV